MSSLRATVAFVLVLVMVGLLLFLIRGHRDLEEAANNTLCGGRPVKVVEVPDGEYRHTILVLVCDGEK